MLSQIFWSAHKVINQLAIRMRGKGGRGEKNLPEACGPFALVNQDRETSYCNEDQFTKKKTTMFWFTQTIIRMELLPLFSIYIGSVRRNLVLYSPQNYNNYHTCASNGIFIKSSTCCNLHATIPHTCPILWSNWSIRSKMVQFESFCLHIRSNAASSKFPFVIELLMNR